MNELRRCNRFCNSKATASVGKDYKTSEYEDVDQSESAQAYDEGCVRDAVSIVVQRVHLFQVDLPSTDYIMIVSSICILRIILARGTESFCCGWSSLIRLIPLVVI